MTSSAIASRYASALVDVVTGSAGRDDPQKDPQKDPQQVVQELRSFEAAMKSSTELRNALNSPAVSPSRKRAVVGRLAGSLQFSRITRNFLFVLIDHRRAAALPEIIEDFETLLDERLGFARVDVTSAQELSPPQREALSRELSRITGKQVRPRYSVDSALIGGAVARVGSTVYDGSVRGQLNALGRRLTTE